MKIGTGLLPRNGRYELLNIKNSSPHVKGRMVNMTIQQIKIGLELCNVAKSLYYKNKEDLSRIHR